MKKDNAILITQNWSDYTPQEYRIYVYTDYKEKDRFYSIQWTKPNNEQLYTIELNILNFINTKFTKKLLYKDTNLFKVIMKREEYIRNSESQWYCNNLLIINWRDFIKETFKYYNEQCADKFYNDYLDYMSIKTNEILFKTRMKIEDEQPNFLKRTKHDSYLTYKYTWPDGHYYIGRTYAGSKRYNNPPKYKGQKVYEWLLKDHKAEIILQDYNPLKIGHTEAQLINVDDPLCLNVRKETWHGEMDASLQFYSTFADFIEDLHDFRKWRQENDKKI